MMENDNSEKEIQEILDYVKGLFDLVKQTMDRQDALENVLYKEILEPARSLNDDFERGKRHDAFMEKHGETLRSYNDKLRAIEGDDFDLAENTFKDYDEGDHSIEEDEYVAALVAKVQDQLDKITKVFGGGNIEVEAKDEDGDGKTSEVSIETDTNDNSGAYSGAYSEGDKEVIEAVDPEEKADEANAESGESTEEETPSEEQEENEEVDTEEEIDALKKELEAELAKERR